MTFAESGERAREALREMHRQVGDLVTDACGIAVRGLLVRHLVMPEDLADTSQVMRFIAEDVSPRTYVNVMGQYRPCGAARHDTEIGRPLRVEEYARALEAARDAGLTRLDGFV